MMQYIFLSLIVYDLRCLDGQAQAINGDWSPWSVIVACNATCGGGVETQVRSCSNPTPQHGGEECVLEDGTNGLTETKEAACNEQSCFENAWTNWTDCDECKVGKRMRYKLCDVDTVCEGADEVIEEGEKCNAWNRTVCPSPCEEVECPEYAVCSDISTDEEPLSKCVCTMGYIMNKDEKACIRPPPTLPTPRPIPTLKPEEKVVATVISKSASTFLIIFVLATLILFFVLRIFTPDRIIQMNMEISLLLAHCCLMAPPESYEHPTICKLISIFIHFFFTACYAFMMLEALHMYSLVANVVKQNGMLTKFQNIAVGWGIAAVVTIFCVSFEYENYGGEYHCWLQMNTSLMIGQFVPIVFIVIVTLTLIEAAGVADEYSPLKGIDEKQLLSAKISQRSNLVILPLVLSHMVVGMFSEYEQNLPLYGTFSVLNGVTGGFIFFLHCTNNQKVRAKLRSCCKSVARRP